MNSIFGKEFKVSGKSFIKFVPDRLEVDHEKRMVKIYGQFSSQRYNRDLSSGYLWYDELERKAAIVGSDFSIIQEDGLAMLAEIMLDEQERYTKVKNYVPPKQYTYRQLPFAAYKGSKIRRFNSCMEYTAWWIEVPSGEVIVEAALVGTSTLVFKSLYQFLSMTGRGKLIGPRISKSPEVRRYKHDRQTQRVNPEVRQLLGDLYIE